MLSSPTKSALALLSVLAIAPLAVGATFYVATDGNDQNDGSRKKPFATPQRAQQAARAAHKPATVVLRGGTYFLPETLVFTAADSDSTWEAYKNETPILSGGVLITGWHEVAPRRWETSVGRLDFSQLYVNDQLRLRPVLPRKGYYYVDKAMPPTKGESPDRFHFADGDIQADWHNLDDVEVTTFHLWTMDRLRIKSVDTVQRIATFTGPTHGGSQSPLTRSTWYRVENVREALTEPGEWYLDRRSGVLTYLAKPGEGLRRTRFIAPRLPQVVRLDSAERITLRGLTIAHNAWNTPPQGYGFMQADVVVDGAVHMRFGGEMDDCVNAMVTKQFVHERAVANVAFDEGVTDGIGKIAEVFEATGVGQGIEVDDVDAGIGLESVPDEIASDEACAAGDEEAVHLE